MFYVYILISEKDRRYYIGCTHDIGLRLKKHNNGEVCSTKHFRPWKLIYHEEYTTLSDSRKRELQI
ncbi:MAG: GIY-YIG nuclease family protein, partial [bacterium]|nr:GIY-YIG nuclease family protein [bacterium]